MDSALTFCALVLFVASLARVDDYTAHNVHHSPKTFLTGDESHQSSSSAARHRKSKRSSARAKTPSSAETSPSPSPTLRVPPESLPAGKAGVSTTPAPSEESKPPPSGANVASVKPEALREFAAQPPKVQQLIRDALSLTEQNLTYTYGSSDPSSGGMDCSGFIYYMLNKAGFKDVPRESSDQYAWVRQKKDFYAVLSRSAESFEFRDLEPGDLMFWSGTYKVDRDIPITHVMIYLGTEKSTGKPVMVGASDGRSYAGVRRFGVSVFDFKMPSGEPNNSDPDLVAKFEGYGRIPGLRDPHLPSDNTVNFTGPATADTAKPSPKKKTKPLSDGD